MMNKKNKIVKFFGIVILVFTLFLLVAPDTVDARRGGFGGRRSFGGSRSRTYKKPRTTKPKSSLGSKRTMKPNTPSAKAASSFGGKRLTNSKAYTSKYGTPRKTTNQTITRNGVSQNYVMHSYGGYGSGLMTGYMMGTTSLLWMMPFHPAFYYSRPYYVDNPDGTVGVYPPTFSWSKLFFTIIIIAVIIYIIRVMFRSKKNI